MVISIPVGLVLLGCKRFLSGWLDLQTLAGSLMAVALTATLFLILLVASGYGLRIREIHELMNNIVNKLKGAGR